MELSPFHIGEQQVQARLGVRETIEPWARRVVRQYLPDQHREFYAQLPFIVAAARDGAGRPWVTLLAGPSGFVQSPNDRTLVLATRPLAGDALESSLTAGSELGLLGIALDTRRRNRVNGTITETGVAGLRVEVGQTFGNCPQYITERQWSQVEVDPATAIVTRHDRLDDDMKAWIGMADTMFIASGYRGKNPSEAFGMDASHRGGTPGFIRVLDDRRLVFPDYAGNNHFNTIGNLVMDPRVGVLFVDFERGSLLQITGTATIDWDSDEVAKHPGAQRLIFIDVDAIVRLDDSLPLRWSEPAGKIRSLKVTRKIQETDDVVSFEFVALDGGELAEFEAGQHLPIEVKVEGLRQPVKRTYSLSNGPGQHRYRISVKRHPNGSMSRLLHDVIQEGDIIGAKSPAGDFVLKCGAKPTVLISAGIGVTPMVSMLHQLAARCVGHPVVFVHGAQDGAHHALAEEVQRLAAANANVTLHISYSRPRPDDVLGRDYHAAGRVTGDLIAELAPALDAEFYLCGPTRFMSDVASALTHFGVHADRIHAETFGSAAG